MSSMSPLATIASKVGSNSLRSLRFSPSIAAPIGIPLASTAIDHFPADLGRVDRTFARFPQVSHGCASGRLGGVPIGRRDVATGVLLTWNMWSTRMPFGRSLNLAEEACAYAAEFASMAYDCASPTMTVPGGGCNSHELFRASARCPQRPASTTRCHSATALGTAANCVLTKSRARQRSSLLATSIRLLHQNSKSARFPG